MPTIQESLSSISGGKVLDIATGVGGFVGALLENLHDVDEIIGIDIEDCGTQAFTNNLADKPARFVKMDAAQMSSRMPASTLSALPTLCTTWRICRASFRK